MARFRQTERNGTGQQTYVGMEIKQTDKSEEKKPVPKKRREDKIPATLRVTLEKPKEVPSPSQGNSMFGLAVPKTNRHIVHDPNNPWNIPEALNKTPSSSDHNNWLTQLKNPKFTSSPAPFIEGSSPASSVCAISPNHQQQSTASSSQ